MVKLIKINGKMVLERPKCPYCEGLVCPRCWENGTSIGGKLSAVEMIKDAERESKLSKT